MLERTIIFVDTSYLLASFYNSWDTGARSQLEIDLPEVVAVLGRMATEQLKQPIQRQYWYDGIPESGPHRYQRSLRNEPGVQLRSGQLIEWGGRRTQKAVDTRLVADMVITALHGHASDIVLVSGDADMLPGVEIAVNAGVRVHLYGFGWDSMSNALRFACDTTTILDPREDFRDTMRLEVLVGPVPPNVNTTDSLADDVNPEAYITLPSDYSPEDFDAPLAPADSSPADNNSADNNSADTDTQDSDAESSGIEVTASTHMQPAPNTRVTESAANTEAPLNTDGTDSNNPEHSTEQTSASTTNNTTTNNHTPSPASMPATAAPLQAEISPQDKLTEDSTNNPNNMPSQRPSPSMMARHRKLRSRYVPLPNEVWASSGGQSPFDIGQQYALWWFDNNANEEQKDNAHTLSGGGLPPEIDRPLLQFACETLHEYTLTEPQRVGLRDGFHAGIRAIMLRPREETTDQ